MEGERQVIRVYKGAEERGGVFGGDWHTDFSFLEHPPAGSVLNAVETPPVGGDTVWISQAAAWDALPDALKALLLGRDAIHVASPLVHEEPTHASGLDRACDPRSSSWCVP